MYGGSGVAVAAPDESLSPYFIFTSIHEQLGERQNNRFLSREQKKVD